MTALCRRRPAYGEEGMDTAFAGMTETWCEFVARISLHMDEGGAKVTEVSDALKLFS